MIRTWSRADVEPGDLFEKDGEIFAVVGIADEPTLTLEPVEGEEHSRYVRRQHHVIGSHLFSAFTKLERRPPGPDPARERISRAISLLTDPSEAHRLIGRSELLGILEGHT